jgi:Recombination endonuclease VII
MIPDPLLMELVDTTEFEAEEARKRAANNAYQKAYNKRRDPVKYKEQMKAIKAKKPELYNKIRRNSSYKRNYGITLLQYEDMCVQQDNMCASCGKTEKLFIDHCHTTGKIRGLLCRYCNSLIGFAKDDPEMLRRAAIYVRRTRG